MKFSLFKSVLDKPKIYGKTGFKRTRNKIIVSGDFAMSEDIVFRSGDIYNKEIIFDGGTYKNIIFLGGSFKKITFRRGHYKGFISIRGGHIKDLMLLGGDFDHWLGTIDGIENNNENGDLLAEEPLVINRFEIEGGSFTNNIWISGGAIQSLEIKCIIANKIHCKPNDDKIFDSELNKYVNKFNSKPRIKNLLISRYSNKDNFYHFNELDIETIKFESFTNIGNITMSKISLEKSISFENSDIGKTTFIDCNFSKQQLFFDSSKITEIALAGALLPSFHNIESTSNNKKTQKQLALSQIKKVYQNMGDSVTASEYHAEELNTYLETLPRGWEKFNLSLNKYSNNHGQNWGKPLGWLLLFTIIFYTLYCYALGFRIDFSGDGTDIFWKNMAYFFEFLNPIRKNDFIPKSLMATQKDFIIPSIAIFIDSIAKIFNAYLLYQFIAAFRKHGKKG